jgi:hypothetical protein
MEELNDLLDKQTMARMGSQATSAAKAFSGLNSSLAKTVDGMNQLLASSSKLPVGSGMKTALGAAEASSEAGRVASESLGKMTAATAAAEGIDIGKSAEVDYGVMQTAGRGAWQDSLFQQITGYEPPKSALDKAEYKNALEDMATLVMRFAYERQKGMDTAQTSDEIAKQKDRLIAAASTYGLDQATIDSAIATISGEQTAQPVPMRPEPTAAPAPTAVSPIPVTVAPASPVLPAPNVQPAPEPAAPAATVPTPTSQAVGTSSVSAPVTASTSSGRSSVGTAVATAEGSKPININVVIEAGPLKRVLLDEGMFGTA